MARYLKSLLAGKGTPRSQAQPAKLSPAALASKLTARLTKAHGTALNADRLVILRLGLGRDSMTMLGLLGAHQLVVEGQERGPDEIDAVVFSDPGGEWEFTYDLIPRVRAFCREHGLRFLVQNKPPAEGPGGWIAWKRHQKTIADALAVQGKTPHGSSYGKPPWRKHRPATIGERAASGYYHARIPLFEDYDRKSAWMIRKNPSCTILHKVEPNREMLQDLAQERFGAWATHKAWSAAVDAGERRPHLMLLGLAADEPARLEKGKEESAKRMAKEGESYEAEAYPLEEMGIGKGDEQRFLDALPGVDPGGRLRKGGFSDVKKSGCRFCKYQDKQQFWMLRELDPEFFERVVDLERRNLARTGPWMAIFPRSLSLQVRGKPSALLQAERRKGHAITPDPEDPGKVWVHTPLDVLVQEWEDDYVAKHGRRPDWEEVAKKEYRGCRIET